MRAERARVRLMFEWGGGCPWCGNDVARNRFPFGPIEEKLPLSDELKAMLSELSALATNHLGDLLLSRA